MEHIKVDESGMNTLISKVELRVVPLRDRKKLIDNNFIFRKEHEVYLILIIPLEISVTESGTIGTKHAIVTKNVLDYFIETSGKTEDDLFEIAKSNTANKSVVVPMMNVVNDLLSEMGLNNDAVKTGEVPLWIISNEERIYGAAGFVIPEVLKKASETIGCDSFYIIPSSIHEVILIPKSEEIGVIDDNLCDLVWEVNQTVVMPRDFLSNNVYEYYDGKLWEVGSI